MNTLLWTYHFYSIEAGFKGPQTMIEIRQIFTLVLAEISFPISLVL